MTTPAPALGGAVKAFLAKGVSTVNTRRNYGIALNALAGNFGEDAPLASLDPGAVAEWLAGRWGDSSDRTKAARITAVKSASAWWRKQGWLTADVAADLERPSRPREVRPGEILSPGEVQAMLDACGKHSVNGIRTRALIMLLYRSGLRIGEALNARPADFDFRTHTVRLRETKAGKAQTAGWYPTADSDLQRWLDKRKAMGIRQGTMFCTYKGGRLTEDSFRRGLTRLAARAGIDGKRVHPHAFRHTFAVELRADGVPVEVISELLRHASITTTLVYLKQLTNGEAVSVLQLANLNNVGGGRPDGPEDEMAALQRRVQELTQRLDEMGDRK